MTSEDIISPKEFFELVFDGLDGYTPINTFPGSGNFVKGAGPVVDQWFKLPEQMDDMVAHVEANKHKDLYFCPTVFEKLPETIEIGDKRKILYGRKKSNAKAGRVVYADADACPPGRFEAQPSITVRTSHERYHTYWLLDGAHSPEDISAIGKTIALRHADEGCDKGGYDTGQLLRVPGSAHTKRTPTTVFVAEVDAQVYSLEELGAIYPPSQVAKPTVAPVGGAARQPIKGKVPANIQARLDGVSAHEGDDNSMNRWQLMLAATQVGYTDGQILTLLDEHPPTEAIRAKNPSRDWDDLELSEIAKARLEHDHVGYKCSRVKCPNKPDWMEPMPEVNVDAPKQTALGLIQSEDGKLHLPDMPKLAASEADAAERVAAEVMVGAYRYTPGLGWLAWDGMRWELSTSAEHRVFAATWKYVREQEEQARKLAMVALAEWSVTEAAIMERAVQQGTNQGPRGGERKPKEVLEATATTDEMDQMEEVKRLIHQADKWMVLLKKSPLNNIVEMCRSVPGVLTSVDELDTHDEHLNTLSGIVNLRTGEVTPHDPGMLITKLAQAHYKQDHTHPVWTKALEALPEESRDWFRLRMGQSAVGSQPESDDLVVNRGDGENGKSAVLTAAMNVLGDYATVVGDRVLMGGDHHTTELMELMGARFAVIEETPEEGRLNPTQLKKTVGSDKIQARRMRQDPVTFRATHSLWINTNYELIVDATDHGVWRRLICLEWPFTFVKPGQPLLHGNQRHGDPRLKVQLADGLVDNEELATAVLSWIIDGARDYLAEIEAKGVIEPPKTVVEATARWRAASDVGLKFAQDMLVPDAGRFIPGTEMVAAFKEYLMAENKAPWSAQTVNTRLPASLLAAGYGQYVAPVKNSKIKKGETVSLRVGGITLPEEYAQPTGWENKKQGKVWHGLRFRTENEEYPEGE